jgi:hypothetical protein
MSKNFDAWNEQKKVADTREIARDFFFHEREVWWCALGANVGMEADGKHDQFERPVLIVNKFQQRHDLGNSPYLKAQGGALFHGGSARGRHFVGRTLPTQNIEHEEAHSQNRNDFPGRLSHHPKKHHRYRDLIKNRTPLQREGFSEAEATNALIIHEANWKSISAKHRRLFCAARSFPTTYIHDM